MEILDSAINRVLEQVTLNKSDILHGYVIMIGEDRMFRDDNGVFIFSSKEQAKKSWYRDVNFRAKRAVYQSTHPQSDNIYAWWRDDEATHSYRDFKKKLIKDYNLRIVKV